MTNKVVFLDYDGVICHQLVRWLKLSPGTRDHGYDINNMHALAKLQREFKFALVCSSRAHAKDSNIVQEATFRQFGIEVWFHRDHRTPYTTECTEDDFNQLVTDGKLEDLINDYSYPTEITWDTTKNFRGYNILSWLKNHPEVTDYIVLDDDYDIFPIPRDNFIHIKDGEVTGGLNMKHIRRIMDAFKQVD